ncbi:hypothetical protein SCP_0110700 [Sparassis crispa]|uniref:Ino eighty subunit 1 n=1 Tax=Sparassis crispa TaxID=139825 RepID=A0A401G7Q1_9APHY|nr:hypothetical protein SCP_0110700 [Sparassis crispa]GBE78187.1 hypothetical protein SCP_0110700 [Sparassis crispa]
MPNSAPQGPHRKNFAVKHADGEPLTRTDLQYDLLHHIFNNSLAVFTDPYPTLSGGPARTKVTFRDLYVNCLVNAEGCSKTSKTKMRQTPQFGDEFGKLSLLSNVGRINTTMAFFIEMRTALRTYHPVPALQKADGNLQDAPRIKNLLKSCLREKNLLTPSEVLSRSEAGEVPPTSIVNIIFIFANHAASIAKAHFDPHLPYDFLDLFTPVHVSSDSRARAFLWLCYHYHEASSCNPFSDAYSDKNIGRIPTLVTLTPEEAALENIDTPEERDLAERMTVRRKVFVDNKANKEQDKGQDGRKSDAKGAAGRVRTRRRKNDAPDTLTNALMEREAVSASLAMPRENGFVSGVVSTPHHLEFVLPEVHLQRSLFLGPQRPLHMAHASEPLLPTRALADPYPRQLSCPEPQRSTDGKPVRTRMRRQRERPAHHIVQEPYAGQPRYVHPSSTPFTYRSPPYVTPSYVPSYAMPAAPRPVGPPHSMLDHAWQVVMTTDPLQDSDDEEFADESTRHDYILRLRVISRLRGKQPTPEPQYLPPISSILPGLI